MKSTRRGKDAGTGEGRPPEAGAPIHDGSGEWSAGLRDDSRAALVGTILAAMPHIDELLADLVADRLGPDARGVLAALARDDDGRLALLGALFGTDPSLSKAIDDYAGLRRLWRSYGSGLWYTHTGGRTYLAAPDSGTATFRVAREVKPADLGRARAEVDRLAGTLAGLIGAPEASARTTPTKTKAKPRSVPKPPSPSAPAPTTETARAKRAAPTRTAGARRRHAPVRPSKEKVPPAGTEHVPEAAE